MLKITSRTTGESKTLVVEGRLAGPWIGELEQVWRELTQQHVGSLVVDLTGVTFIEPAGKDLLRTMWRGGAELLASGCCSRSIVAEITAGGRAMAESRTESGTPQ